MNYSDTYQLFMDWNFNVIMDVFDNLQTTYQDQGYLNNSESTGFIDMIMNNVNLYHRRNKLQKNRRNTENTLIENTLIENINDNKNDDDKNDDDKNDDETI
jgi:hypothetical protein